MNKEQLEAFKQGVDAGFDLALDHMSNDFSSKDATESIKEKLERLKQIESAELYIAGLSVNTLERIVTQYRNKTGDNIYIGLKFMYWVYESKIKGK